MMKTIARLEHKIGDRVYQFYCDPDSPLGEVKDAFCQFLGFVSQVEKTALEQKLKEDEQKKEEIIEAE